MGSESRKRLVSLLFYSTTTKRSLEIRDDVREADTPAPDVENRELGHHERLSEHGTTARSCVLERAGAD